MTEKQLHELTKQLKKEYPEFSKVRIRDEVIFIPKTMVDALQKIFSKNL